MPGGSTQPPDRANPAPSIRAPGCYVLLPAWDSAIAPAPGTPPPARDVPTDTRPSPASATPQHTQALPPIPAGKSPRPPPTAQPGAQSRQLLMLREQMAYSHSK